MRVQLLLSNGISLLTEELIDLLRIRRKPRVIQLPITSRCNSRCMTCNVWKKDKKEMKDMPHEELKWVLGNSFFSEVTSVGINGGEFTLDKSTIEVIDSVLTLPKIKNIYMISNGLFPGKLLEYMSIIKKRCKEKHVQVALTLSMDGVGSIQNQIRGVPLAWNKVLESLNCVLKDREKYCDSIGLGCTISKYNVAYLPMLEEYTKSINISIEWHLAVPNKRIGVFDDHDFSVLSSDTARLLAIEFFFKKMHSQEESLSKRINYFIQYKYLLNSGKGRMARCAYLNRDVTIDEDLKMYLCATASDEIGDLRKNTPSEVLNSSTYKKVYKDVHKCCNTCIHYVWSPNIKALFSLFMYRVERKYTIPMFKFLLRW